MRKIDMEAVDDLELYTLNNRLIYDRNIMPAIKNLKKKHAKGVYSHEKACKLWEHVTEAAAKMYNNEFGNGLWYHLFPKAERQECAKILEAYFYEEYIV